MLIDISMKITKAMFDNTVTDKALVGHIGTHFDVMDEDFPLEYTKRVGIVFDVSEVANRDVHICDVDLDKVKEDMFVAFYSGYCENVSYEEKGYFISHPQLSTELIEALVEKKISIIGLGFAGIRRGNEHIPMDRYCAQHKVFVVENLRELDKLLLHESFTVYTFPMNVEGVTGLPCRVVVEVENDIISD